MFDRTIRTLSTFVLGLSLTFGLSACDPGLIDPDSLRLEVVLEGVPQDAEELQVEVIRGQQTITRAPRPTASLSVFFADLGEGSVLVTAFARRDGRIIAEGAAEGTLDGSLTVLRITLTEDEEPIDPGPEECEEYTDDGFACPEKIAELQGVQRFIVLEGGSVYALVRDGNVTKLFSFASTEPAEPIAGLKVRPSSVAISPSNKEFAFLGDYGSGDELIVLQDRGVRFLGAGYVQGQFGYLADDTLWGLKGYESNNGVGALQIWRPGENTLVETADCHPGVKARLVTHGWTMTPIFEVDLNSEPLLHLAADPTDGLKCKSIVDLSTTGVTALFGTASLEQNQWGLVLKADRSGAPFAVLVGSDGTSLRIVELEFDGLLATTDSQLLFIATDTKIVYVDGDGVERSIPNSAGRLKHLEVLDDTPGAEVLWGVTTEEEVAFKGSRDENLADTGQRGVTSLRIPDGTNERLLLWDSLEANARLLALNYRARFNPPSLGASLAGDVLFWRHGTRPTHGGGSTQILLGTGGGYQDFLTKADTGARAGGASTVSTKGFAYVRTDTRMAWFTAAPGNPGAQLAEGPATAVMWHPGEELFWVAFEDGTVARVGAPKEEQ